MCVQQFLQLYIRQIPHVQSNKLIKKATYVRLELIQFLTPHNLHVAIERRSARKSAE